MMKLLLLVALVLAIMNAVEGGEASSCRKHGGKYANSCSEGETKLPRNCWAKMKECCIPTAALSCYGADTAGVCLSKKSCEKAGQVIEGTDGYCPTVKDKPRICCDAGLTCPVSETPETPEEVPEGFEQVDTGKDCVGNDIHSADVTLQECANLCQDNQLCVGFIYSTNEIASVPCFLKWKCNQFQDLANTAPYIKVRAGPDEVPDGFSQIATGKDCVGNDIHSALVTVPECADLCQENPLCVGFIFSTNAIARVTCFLKSKCDQFQDLTDTAPYMKEVEEGEVRLQGGPSPLEGRAEMYMNGRWGSVCDWQAWPKGWPSVFCKQLGYGVATSIAHPSEKGLATPPNLPIAISIDGCSPADTNTMLECPTDSNECGHEQDYYVVCGGA